MRIRALQGGHFTGGHFTPTEAGPAVMEEGQ